jgi:hypothetical protein
MSTTIIKNPEERQTSRKLLQLDNAFTRSLTQFDVTEQDGDHGSNFWQHILSVGRDGLPNGNVRDFDRFE